ncbi:MAG: hypothetical protein H7Y13_06370 [Sphingobacteriaceae bacterium]|nr:hypothetical protein [Sphingobacteriaceae bacterium]
MKKYFRRKAKKAANDEGFELMASKLFLYPGLLIILSALAYLMLNFSKDNLSVGMWLPFMFIGVFLVLMSLLIKSRKSNS